MGGYLLHRGVRFGLVVALLCGVPAARAAVLLPPDAAEQALLPPHDAVHKELFRPTAGQTAWLADELGYAPPRDAYVWRVAERDGQPVGYLMFDNELGKHEPITFAVALDAEGRVANVAVCIYRETRGDEIKRDSFMHQFIGRAFGEPLRLDREIVHVSGATISSRSAVTVVNRALALWQARYGDATAGGAAE